jgi:DNA topoisomerase I
MDKRLAFHAERYGLLVVDPEEFLIERRRHGRGHAIVFTGGDRPVTVEVKARIRALGIPPAWREVRVCVEENGHIQAIGRDEKDRIQYRYHADWVNVRNAVKTERLLRFGKALPRLRKRIRRDMRRTEVDRRATAATAARLVDLAAMRPGHEKYAEDGGRGVASLTKRDFRLATGGGGNLRFTGKSSKLNEVEIRDRPLLKSVDRIRKLKGQRLFSYRDGKRKSRNLTAPVLNEYLRESAESKISAKDFRTFHGSAEALRFLLDEVAPGACDTEAKRRRAVAAAMRSVSQRLRNTPAVARASYVHPEIVSAFEESRLDPALLRGRARDGLTREETGLMRFLEDVATK